MTIDRTPENARKEDPPDPGASPTLKTDPPDISQDSTKKTAKSVAHSVLSSSPSLNRFKERLSLHKKPTP